MLKVYKYMHEQGKDSNWKKVTNEEIRFRMEEDFTNDDISEVDKFSKTVWYMKEYLSTLGRIC